MYEIIPCCFLFLANIHFYFSLPDKIQRESLVKVQRVVVYHIHNEPSSECQQMWFKYFTMNCFMILFFYKMNPHHYLGPIHKKWSYRPLKTINFCVDAFSSSPFLFPMRAPDTGLQGFTTLHIYTSERADGRLRPWNPYKHYLCRLIWSTHSFHLWVSLGILKLGMAIVRRKSI